MYSEHKTRLSVNEILDNFKYFLDIKYDAEVSNLLNIKPQALSVCRHRESPTILFPMMDYLVANDIEIEKIFYKNKNKN